MSHPASCTDPACELRYVEHLRTIQVSPAAMPSRSVTRYEGATDEPTEVTRERQSRFDRESIAYRQLAEGGAKTPTLAEAPRALRELGG